MTPSELITELKLILKVHPEAKDHTLFVRVEDGWGTSIGSAPINSLRYDTKRKRIILEGVD